MTAQKVFGIAGWKNSGKTGLAVRIVTELTARGYRVSTIKHAHHDFDIDKVGADSWRHRQAGAHEVTIVSGTRFAIMHELRGEPEPSFEEILSRLAPCDLVLIEGYKYEPVPKIEARRLEAEEYWAELRAEGEERRAEVAGVSDERGACSAPAQAGNLHPGPSRARQA